ncbi:MAG: U32 family peptidase [Dysgonamonadaceae bacterium]|jgi:putative protease|nr:U32 family peptidase [Dysgonamonadaceae bacterium]
MKTVRKIELLAPAKNLETGIEALRHGADAVYIGAPKFSARAAAGNSIEDIRRLVEEAHIFHAKVYVALNTILTNDELPEAERLIYDIYFAGADALIIQDMGILNLPLPPIAIHASTQTDNRSVEKVRFLEQAGFSQVVLARELSLDEIRDVADHTHVRLEAFIHGALCASFSGQCYISQAVSGRSANRGECAQYCRLPYTLSDGRAKTIATNKHLLSLKDLNQSAHLEALLDAGVTSLKIEGRLKDLSYVKNITAWYRKQLDRIFERRPEYRAASSGETVPFFIPNPEKTFNRGFTDYFLNGRKPGIASPDTPKSLGEPAGRVKDIQDRYFVLAGENHTTGQKAIHNGDGLCFLTPKGLIGFRVNRAEGRKIFPTDMPRLDKEVLLFRNYDHEFEKVLSKKSAERKIRIEWALEENNFGFSLTAIDEDDYSATVTAEWKKELSVKEPTANIREQLSKLGNTPFTMTRLSIRLSSQWFIPSSVLSELRRKGVEALLQVRQIGFLRPVAVIRPTNHPYPAIELSYLGNVANESARQFYRQHGVTAIAPAFEMEPPKNVPLMFTKHCLKYMFGHCPKQNPALPCSEPWILSAGNRRFALHFDCRNCQMLVFENE